MSHLAWLFSFLSFYSTLLKSSNAIETLSTGNFVRISLILASGALSLWCILLRKGAIILLFRGAQKWLLLYAIMAIISGTYASHGFYSIWKSLEIFADVLLVAAVLSYDKPEESAQKLYGICVSVFFVLLLTVWIGAMVAPHKAITHSRGLLSIQLQGVWPHINPNGLAFISAFLMIAFLGNMRSEKIAMKAFWLLLIGMTGVTLVLAQSRTSMIGCLIAILVYCILTRNKWLIALSFLAVITSALWGAGQHLAYEYLQRGQSAELAMSFSGRTIAWKAALESFYRSPILGNGFASASRFDVLGGGAMSTLHGAVFDVLAGVGILGFIPWLLAVLSTTWRLGMGAISTRGLDSNRISNRAELFAVMVLILIRATTSSGLALHDQTFLLFIILIMMSWNFTKPLKISLKSGSSPTN